MTSLFQRPGKKIYYNFYINVLQTIIIDLHDIVFIQNIVRLVSLTSEQR